MLVRKPVLFDSEVDKDILDHLKGIKKSFAGYVRDLIREDITRSKTKNIDLSAILLQAIANGINTQSNIPQPESKEKEPDIVEEDKMCSEDLESLSRLIDDD